MSRKTVLMVVLALGCVSAATVVGLRSSRDRGHASDGLKRAPVFTLPRSNGEKIDVSDFRDHVVVVHFWASWCAPCIPEIPEILGAAKRLPKDRTGRKIVWLLVSQDESWAKAHSILKEETLPENVISVLDTDTKVSDQFGSYQFPETYLISRSGGLAAKWIGPQEWSGAWGERAITGIEQLSRENTVPTEAPPDSPHGPSGM